MAKNFYFGKIADIVAGSANFASTLGAGPTVYGISTTQSAAFGTLNTALQTAQALTLHPSTRTSVTIKNRDDALKSMRKNAQLLAKIIYATSTVTDGMLTDLGLLPRTTRTPVTPVIDAPVVEVESVKERLVRFRIHQAGDTLSRGKPRGVVGINIFTFVGDVRPVDAAAYYFQGMSTRAITDVIFADSIASGSRVWVSASWVGSRGELSVASTPISFILQGGDVGASREAA